jgi:hypothetical protein
MIIKLELLLISILIGIAIIYINAPKPEIILKLPYKNHWKKTVQFPLPPEKIDQKIQPLLISVPKEIIRKK